MNKKIRNALIISLVGTAIISTGLYFMFKNTTKKENTIEVAVATREIKAGEVFNDDNYKYVSIPESKVSASYVTKVKMADNSVTDVLKGKEVLSTIYPNEEIVKGRVSNMSALTDDKGNVIDTSSYRKLMLEVGTSQELSGQVVSGDKIDFWVRYTLNDKTNKDKLIVVDKIMKNVIVNKCYDSEGNEITDTTQKAKTVELLVTEEELQEYIKYKDLGKYTLVKVPSGSDGSSNDDIVRKKISTNDLIWEVISMKDDEVTADKITKDKDKEKEISNYEISLED